MDKRTEHPAPPPAEGAAAPAATLELDALAGMQESLANLLGTVVAVRGPDGKPVGEPSLPAPFFRMLAGRSGDVLERLSRLGASEHTSPILIDGKPHAQLVIAERPAEAPSPDAMRRMAAECGADPAALSAAASALPRWSGMQREAALRHLAATASLVSRLLGRRRELMRRDHQLRGLLKISDLLVEGRNLTSVLNTIARQVVELLGARAAMIRILDEGASELVARAVHRLSWQFVAKGPVRLGESEYDRRALAGEIVSVDDVVSDPRTLYPDSMKREGLVSSLLVGMIHAGEPIGTLRIYTDAQRDWTDDDKSLFRAVADHAALAVINTRLFEDVRRMERLERDVRVGRQVQRRMIPTRPPAVNGFQIGTVYEPSSRICGDFFDFIPLSNDRVGIAIGDVMGNGVSAALWMASVRASLRANLEYETDIAAVLQRVNRALCRDTLTDQFATMFFGILDPKARTLTYGNAGHEPPVRLRAGKEEALPCGSPLIGVMPDAVFEQATVTFDSGDLLVLWTDGAAGVMNFFDEPFGRDRILKAASAKIDQSAETVAHHILWEIRRFAGLNTARDDITAVVLKAM